MHNMAGGSILSAWLQTALQMADSGTDGRTDVWLFSNQTKFNHSKFIAYFSTVAGGRGWFTVPLLFMYLRTCARDFGDFAFFVIPFCLITCCSCQDFAARVCMFLCTSLLAFCVCKSPKASANWLGDKCICQSFNLRPARSLLRATENGERRTESLSSHASLLGETPIVFIDFISAIPLFIPMCWLVDGQLFDGVLSWQPELSQSQKSVTNMLPAYNSPTYVAQEEYSSWRRKISDAMAVN